MPKQPKLSDMQLVLLSTASQRVDGNFFPPAESLAGAAPLVWFSGRWKLNVTNAPLARDILSHIRNDRTMADKTLSAAWKGQPAKEFARHFLQIVEAESKDKWLAYWDLYNRTIAELPTNAYVQYLERKPARRAKVKYVLLAQMYEFPGLQRRKDGDHQSAPVWFRLTGLTITDDPKVSKHYFALWRHAMLEGASRRAIFGNFRMSESSSVTNAIGRAGSSAITSRSA
jgi:hypothetical protein